MSHKPYSSVIVSDRLWPALAQALGIEGDLYDRVNKVELVLEPMQPVQITVTLGILGDAKFERIDWPQFDPTQVHIKGQG